MLLSDDIYGIYRLHTYWMNADNLLTSMRITHVIYITFIRNTVWQTQIVDLVQKQGAGKLTRISTIF